MSVRKLLDGLLNMSKTEQNGTLILLFILLLFIVFRFVVPSFLNDDDNHIKEIEEQINLLEKQRDSIRNVESAFNTSADSIVLDDIKKKGVQTKAEVKIELFFFDPNSVDLNDMLRLGLKLKTARTLIKFRDKGAVFYKPSDLLKVYGIDTASYIRLKPFIHIQKVSFKKEYVSQPSVASLSEVRSVFEINSADSTMWTTLPGIGPVFARRICKFRNYLGGFVKIEQLKEVYHFSPETYALISDRLVIDTLLIQKMNINFFEIDQLKKHPYCNYSDARSIIHFRAIHGSYRSIEQLAVDSVLTYDVYERLSPYLTIR